MTRVLSCLFYFAAMSSSFAQLRGGPQARPAPSPEIGTGYESVAVIVFFAVAWIVVRWLKRRAQAS
jgi:hypothetical protein